MSHISQEFVRRAAPDLPKIKARLALIFGNQNPDIVRQMVDHAASLYHSGHIRRIIVTGGVMFKEKKNVISESHYARNLLVARGICAKHIYVESHSTNTLENVVNARRLVMQKEGVLRREPIVCMGREYATRRFLMTLAAKWPEVIPSFTGFDNFSKPKKEWHTCPDISALVMKDIEKWPVYQSRGHLKQINLQHLNRKLQAANKSRRA